ncbi:hypothetical protein V6N13_075880 [Hibiscus sabdariffa]
MPYYFSLSFVLCILATKRVTTLLEGRSFQSPLVTDFRIVPKGTEGAVSLEGKIVGLLASVLLASIGCLLVEI